MASHAARQGQPAEGVTFIETALTGTRGRATPALLAELHFRQAYVFATLGDTSACTAEIFQARTQAEQLKPDDDPPWLYWLDPAAIAVGAGDCLLLLGQPDQATALLGEGIIQLGTPFIHEQIYQTRLAEALTRPGKQRDLDAAAGLGHAVNRLDREPGVTHRGRPSPRPLLPAKAVRQGSGGARLCGAGAGLCGGPVMATLLPPRTPRPAPGRSAPR
jgi:hypothetical protein